MTEALDENREFFVRSAPDVANDLEGRPMDLVIETSTSLERYRFTGVRPYLEVEATRPWKGNVLEQMRRFEGGTIIVYRRRSGLLPFIKTIGGDNVEILSLENLRDGSKLEIPTKVANLLGLDHRQKGRLRLVDQRTLQFERISI